MKKLIPFLLIVLAGCSSAPSSKLPERGWINILDHGGRPAASVNQFTGETIFHQEPEKAFEALYVAYVGLAQTKAAPATETKPETKVPAKPPTKKAEAKSGNPTPSPETH